MNTGIQMVLLQGSGEPSDSTCRCIGERKGHGANEMRRKHQIVQLPRLRDFPLDIPIVSNLSVHAPPLLIVVHGNTSTHLMLFSTSQYGLQVARQVNQRLGDIADQAFL
jgi:hypothetical protein